MLEGGGNPWRGMVYGITNRAGYTRVGPSEIWKFWDEYGFQSMDMIGYWDDNNPITCSNPSVKATVFKGKDVMVVAVASWSDKDEEVTLAFNSAKAGFDLDSGDVFIPGIVNFQEKQNTVSLNNMVIPGGKGYLIVIKKK
jgi:hypothetical protein